MALPLKSGADLYTQELLRARLHNFDGDLAEYGTGSIYFNTTSGLNTSDRIRYRGLTNWHSVANLEDIARLEKMIGNLDLAGSEDFIGITSRVAALEGNFTNGAAKDAVKFGGQLPSYYATQSAFSALQDKVNAFLDGDVDSDAVLENLKEIQAFLDSYDGATSLVDLLDTKADKSQLSGYLPLNGGTMQDLTGYMCPLFLLGNDTYVALGLSIGKNEPQAYLAFDGNELRYVKPDTSWNTLLHVNNFNSYAPTLTGTGASGTWGIDISGRAAKLTNNYVNNLDNAPVDAMFASGFKASNLPATNYATGFTLENYELGRLVQFAIDTNANAHIRQKGTAWSAWKQIAFTDSDITGNAASATKLATARTIWGQSFDGTADVSGSLTLSNNSDINGLASDGTSVALMAVGSDDIVRIASGAFYQQKATRLYGKSLAFYTSTTPSMFINESGYVGIGTPIPQEKLHVVGNLYVTGNIIADGQVSSGGVAEEGTEVSGSLERVTFTIPSGTTSFECEHNLGTKEISVSIYEEGGDYQQILADVYLDSTNIARIVFGRTTDVAHKVVIIG